MRIAIISGSWPPDHCGVGDYAEKLAGALRDLGIEVTCIGGEPWSGTRTLRDLRKALAARSYDLVHIQYPTMGFGRSFIPAVLAILPRDIPFVVTIHEFSSFRLARRLWFMTFAHCVDLRIFTSKSEKTKFARRMRPIRGQDLVVPIGSNIPPSSDGPRGEETICYFGLLCPGKGLEEFLDLASLARPTGWRFALIGAATKMYEAYADAVIDRARSLRVSLHLNEPEAEVGRLLSSTEIAYLPFPDGASDTRGSLHAAMRNGAVVVTRHADCTSAAIKATTAHAGTVAEARHQIEILLGDDQLRDRIRRSAQDVPPGWRDIAEAHLAGFASALAARRARSDRRRPRPIADRARGLHDA